MNAHSIAFASCIAIAMVAAPAQAGQREIHVNGERLNDFGLVLIDIVNCGSPVPSGRYWIDWARRTWGYQGSRNAAPLPDCAQARAAAPAAGGRARAWEDRVHESLRARGGRCNVDIVVNPVYQ